MDYRKLMNESPTVIGMITSTLQSGGSIDTAIRYISESGPNLSKGLFSDAVRRTDMKEYRSLSEGLGSSLSELPQTASGYRRSVMLCVSASESSDDGSRNRMLEEAADISLQSVKEVGRSYGSSLTVPCMAVFGIGIMVPMILMSILPMLSVGGMFGSRMMDEGQIVLITLVIIPASILMLAVYIRNINPFLSYTAKRFNISLAAPLLLVVPLMFVFPQSGVGQDEIFLFSVTPSCIVTVLLLIGPVRDAKKSIACEQSMMDSVFDIGNRMISGSNFERSVVDSLKTRKECHEISVDLDRGFSLCRGDVSRSLEETLGNVSHEMSSILRNIHSCSTIDNEDAGRLAMSLGKQLLNRNQAARDLEIKLKSTTDMMHGTAMVFAPMVLGMSISMMEPLSKLTGYVAIEDTSVILGGYLVELCALISVLVSSLGKGENLGFILWRFCIMCPISLLVFGLCSNISL